MREAKGPKKEPGSPVANADPCLFNFQRRSWRRGGDISPASPRKSPPFEFLYFSARPGSRSDAPWQRLLLLPARGRGRLIRRRLPLDVSRGGGGIPAAPFFPKRLIKGGVSSPFLTGGMVSPNLRRKDGGCNLSFSLRLTAHRRWKNFHASKVLFEARVWSPAKKRKNRANKSTPLDLLVACQAALAVVRPSCFYFLQFSKGFSLSGTPASGAWSQKACL